VASVASLPSGLRLAAVRPARRWVLCAWRLLRPSTSDERFQSSQRSIDAPIYFGAQGPQLVAGAIDLVEESQGL
jgi:hypothetical protein